MKYEFITKSGESYSFWIKKNWFFNRDTKEDYEAWSLITRPFGYIFELIKSDCGYIIKWDRYAGRKEEIARIPGYVEYLDRFVKLMVFS